MTQVSTYYAPHTCSASPTPQVLGSLREEVQSLTRRLTTAQDAEARMAAQLTVRVHDTARRRAQGHSSSTVRAGVPYSRAENSIVVG